MQTAASLTIQEEWGEGRADSYAALQRTNAKEKRKIMSILCYFVVSIIFGTCHIIEDYL
jgi:hypothetical protein